MNSTKSGGHAKATIVRENGSIFIKTAESSELLSSGGMLLNKVQQVFQVDLGYRTGEPKAHLSDDNIEQCPYCGSMNTMGNGTRTTQTEIQNRRLCNSCHRTYAAGKTYPKPKEDTNRLRGKIQLLSVCQYNALEISQELEVSLPSVVEYLNSITDHKLKALNRFSFAKPFDTSKQTPDNIGKTTIWDYNGSLAIKRAGNPNVVFITKSDKELMEQLSNEQLTIYLSRIPAKKRDVIKNYIDDVLDYKLGIIPRTHPDTRPKADCGDIDSEVFEEGQERASTEPSED